MNLGKWEHVCCSKVSAETPGTRITLGEVCQRSSEADAIKSYLPSRAATAWPLAPFFEVAHGLFLEHEVQVEWKIRRSQVSRIY